MTWTSVIDGRTGTPGTLALPGAWMSGARSLMPGRGGDLPVGEEARVSCDGIPGDDLTDAVLAMGAAIPDRPTWLDLLDCDPLAPVSSVDLDEHPLEEEMRSYLPALRDVFRRPRTHLELRTARVPASRARRIDPDAVNWLAGHTEDWAHLTLRGVQPLRVLAEVRDVRWDLYENRVAVRLVDHLLAWLEKRINRLGAWLRRFDDLARLQASAGLDGSWRRRDRVFRLWKDADLEQNRKRQAERRLRRLLAFRRALDELRDAPLYSAIPPRASVPDVLRPSNVLQHDANYRKVAALWRAWAAHERTESLDGERYLARQDDAARAWRRFTSLLVLRALDQLGYEPENPGAIVAEGEVVRLDAFALDLRDPGCILVRDDDGSTLRLVPLLADLVKARDRDGAVAAIEFQGGDHTIVLHLAAAADVPQEAAVLVGLAHERGERRVGLVPVSPWDIGSTERVARALRWFLLGARLRSWPPVVSKHDTPSAAPWLKREPGPWLLLRRPRAAEFDLAAMDQSVRDLEADLAAAEAARERVKQEARDNKDDHRKRTDLNERGKRLNEERQALAHRLETLRTACESLHRGVAVLDAIALCPVCLATGRREAGTLSPRGASTFVCTCECGAEWGTVACTCGERVPFLRTVRPENLAEAVASATGADWVDRTLGQDVLAVPHREEAGRLACTRCGTGVG